MNKKVKQCNHCGEEKILEDFPKAKRSSDGRYNICKGCKNKKAREVYNGRGEQKEKDRENKLQRKYGIGIIEYNKMLVKQEGKCCICGTINPGNGQTNFAIDHNHKTGEVRGLLCRPCNQALGLFKDSPEILEKATTYLKERGYYG